jgi:hypothetical protein
MNTYNLEIIVKDMNTYNLEIIIKDMNTYNFISFIIISKL